MYIYRYENSASEALQLFNQARRDTEWGEKALFSMVNICLNLDSDTIGGETARAVERDGRLGHLCVCNHASLTSLYLQFPGRTDGSYTDGRKTTKGTY